MCTDKCPENTFTFNISSSLARCVYNCTSTESHFIKDYVCTKSCDYYEEINGNYFCKTFSDCSEMFLNKNSTHI